MVILNNDIIENRMISRFEEDAIRVIGKYAYINRVSIIDTCHSDAAHRDAIQIIPPNECRNLQFAGASTNHVSICNCSIFSQGQLQGIFCSDGLIESAYITDNQIETMSEHKITINGLMSGVISRNVNAEGDPVRVVLNNLRIGGAENIWIKSFRNKEYGRVIGENIIDNRGKNDKRGICLDDFDLDAFVNTAKSLTYCDTESYCNDLASLAIQYGKT